MAFDLEQLNQKLEGYPSEVAESFERFGRDGNLADFESGFLGALGFLSEESNVDAVRKAPDEARLREDLNVDSLALVELVFLLEDTFDIAIADEEIQNVQTVGDFKRVAREKLADAMD